MTLRHTLVALVFLLCATATPTHAKDAILGLEHKVPSLSAHDQSPIHLYLWEKRAKKIEPAQFSTSGKVVLLVHGATIPGRPDFDLQFPPDKNGLTYSLMDFLAAEGFDVFSVDIQNYGGSDAVPCGLCVTSQVAANDIGAAVDYIRKLRGVERVNLLGWSWGATTTGLYAQQHPAKVNRLVQYALYLEPSKPGATYDGGEFRPVDLEACCREDFVAEATDKGVFEAYAEQSLRWKKQAPNGIRLDVFTKMPLLDPKQIKVPTMLIYGAKDSVCRVDQEPLPGYFRDLATEDKSLVIVPNGGHALLLEQMRGRFYSEVLKWFAPVGPTVERKPPMSVDQVREFATRYTQAWCSQEAESVAAFFADQGSLKINDGAPAVGRDAIKASAQGFMSAFPDMVVRMDALEAAGENYVYRWTLTGTNTGPGGTGKRVKISGHEEWTLGTNGLIERSLGHFDAAEYQHQLQNGAPQ